MEPGTTTHHLTLYRARSGALVFSAGSIQWTWGLDQEHDGNGAPADPRMQQAQVNLLADMGAQPASLVFALVLATASTDHTAPVATITAPAAGATIANGSERHRQRHRHRCRADRSPASRSPPTAVRPGTPRPAPRTGRTATCKQGSGTATVQVRAIDDSGNYPADTGLGPSP